LVKAIDAGPWDTTWERRRQLFGRAYGKSRRPVADIPLWGRSLGDRISRELLDEPPLDQMLVNEYLPGQGIAMHRDYEPFDRTVVSVSLLSACVMDFRHATDGRRGAMLLRPRSVLVLTDEARYEWEHGIARRKSDRWQGVVIPRRRRLSITFRRMKATWPPALPGVELVPV
jgi:alkylated DNA repair dioxygenase AlkB